METCSYALEIFRSIDIKHLFNFKEYFYVFDTLYKCHLKTYNSTQDFHLSNKVAVNMFICKSLQLIVFNVNVDFDIFFGRCVDIGFINCKCKAILRDSMLLLQYSFVTLLRFNVGKELSIICNQEAPTQPLVNDAATL